MDTNQKIHSSIRTRSVRFERIKGYTMPAISGTVSDLSESYRNNFLFKMVNSLQF